MDFKVKLNSYVKKINDSLDSLVAEDSSLENTVYKAMKYSIDAGGKRLRPVLSLAVCELLDGNEQEVMPFACALEMIHTYSLIHDDLPAMDNDDYRRGRLTNHKVFGEAAAILAGDALLNYAFETMLGYSCSNTENQTAKIQAMNLIAKASGTRGMIGGQIVDMESEGKKIDQSTLEYMHRCKTGALIRAAVLAPAVLCNANVEEFKKLQTYAENIGLAFQIKDDILDVEGDANILGKPIGSDESNNKSTFVTLNGLEKSKAMLNAITNEAIESIMTFGEKSQFLVDLASYLVHRQNQ